MDGYGVLRFPEGSGRQGRMERYCCNVICGAPTTSKVYGLRWDDDYIAHDFSFSSFDKADAEWPRLLKETYLLHRLLLHFQMSVCMCVFGFNVAFKIFSIISRRYISKWTEFQSIVLNSKLVNNVCLFVNAWIFFFFFFFFCINNLCIYCLSLLW